MKSGDKTYIVKTDSVFNNIEDGQYFNIVNDGKIIFHLSSEELMGFLLLDRFVVSDIDNVRYNNIIYFIKSNHLAIKKIYVRFIKLNNSYFVRIKIESDINHVIAEYNSLL
jgi:hypothetical protein